MFLTIKKNKIWREIIIFLQKFNIKTIRISNDDAESNIQILEKRIMELVPSLTKEG